MRLALLQGVKSLSFVVALSLPFRTVAADIVTLSFAPACAGTGVVTLSTGTYNQAGFTLTTNGALAQWCTGSPNFGGAGAFVNAFGGTGTLTRDGGGTFAATSIDLAGVFAGITSSGGLTFTGHLAGGGIVQQTFPFVANQPTPTFTTFAFDPAFGDLASLDLAVSGNIQGPQPPLYQFTNIRLNTLTTTPEPATLLLVSTGVFGVVAFTRTRRKSKS